ncbi:MAG TPA: hypothetical protein VK604_08435 [Bryobacteraceae bacterium]|nr:hypothetical protein [Bryobacteraceae bacterium]
MDRASLWRPAAICFAALAVDVRMPRGVGGWRRRYSAHLLAPVAHANPLRRPWGVDLLNLMSLLNGYGRILELP